MFLIKQTSSRNTLQRELVLGAVQSMTNHPTAAEIYDSIHEKHPSVSRATVYRNLGLLSDQNIIRRVSHLNAADRFDFELKPHYHFRCTSCDRVYDVELPYMHDLLGQVKNPDGFLLEGYEITFTGLCPACGKAQNV